MRVASINVNGIRAANFTGKSASRGYTMRDWLQSAAPDVVAMQELKATRSELEDALEFLGIDNFYMTDESWKKGAAGVGVAVLDKAIQVLDVRTPFQDCKKALEIRSKGRWIELDLKKGDLEFTLVNAYIHHADSPTVKLSDGSMIDREKSEKTMDDKHNFMDMASTRIRTLEEQGKELLVVGDFNIAHKDIDLKNAKGNKTKAGFLPEERAWLDLWLSQSSSTSKNDETLKCALQDYLHNETIGYSAPKYPARQFSAGGLGLVDICRELWGVDEAKYSWWTYMGHAFDNDAGWRIDYQMATSGLAERAVSAEIDRQPGYDKRWSDHAPVVVEL